VDVNFAPGEEVKLSRLPTLPEAVVFLSLIHKLVAIGLTRIVRNSGYRSLTSAERALCNALRPTGAHADVDSGKGVWAALSNGPQWAYRWEEIDANCAGRRQGDPHS